MFEFKFTMTDEDFIRYNSYFYQKDIKKSKPKNILFSALCFVFAISVIASTIIGTSIPLILRYFMFAAGAFIVGVGISPFKAVKTLKKQTAERYNACRQKGRLLSDEEMQCTFDEDKIESIREDSHSIWKYTTVCNVEIDEGALYVMLDPSIAFIIPARAFESDEQREEFVKFIESKIEENKNAQVQQ